MNAGRRYPVGAELISFDTVSWRVWAPDHSSVDVVVNGRALALTQEQGGYFSIDAAGRAGDRYGFRLGGDPQVFPDPASKSQPDGPLALSAVVDLSGYAWSDDAWPGVALPGQVISEIHVGTYTPEGTWPALARHLRQLREAGITVIQMMPVAAFAGQYGWGYDGTLWFAPTHLYGTPRDLQAFIDAAHGEGLAVILDVVYNHLGPAGNWLPRFSSSYFTRAKANEWGESLNFDGPGSAGVRELVLSNIEYWIREFHVDGFRLDAVQEIHDASPDHLLAALARRARDTARPRSVVVIAEHEPQHARLIRPAVEAGYGLDGIFNEDFHHSARVALTGVRDAYFSDYRGTAEEWLSTVLWGFLFQGQWYSWQSAARGQAALDVPAHRFVCFLENHDQVANAADGERLIQRTSPGAYRAMTALLLLGPWTPLLFQGQEWGSLSPFRYFVDHDETLQRAVSEGRHAFLAQFSRNGPIDSPAPALDRSSFERSRLDHAPAATRTPAAALFRDLLTMRRDDGSLGQQARRIHGAAIGHRRLLLRFIGRTPGDDRILVVNLEPDADLSSLAHPLVAPPDASRWQIQWSTEQREYGGAGTPLVRGAPERLVAAGHAATIFRAVPLT